MDVWLLHGLFGLLLIMPWQSQKGIRALDEHVRRDKDARVMFYRGAIIGQWVLAAVAIGAIWSHGQDYLPSLIEPELGGDALAVLAIGSLALLSQCPLVPWVHARMRRSRAVRDALHPLRNILPRSDAEKRLWVHVALTAGFCEEILFRGFLIYYGQAILGLESTGAVALSSAVFAICHFYQGTMNMLRVGFVGLLLGAIMIVTDSLVFCIALHAVLDLGALRMADIVPADDADESLTT